MTLPADASRYGNAATLDVLRAPPSRRPHLLFLRCGRNPARVLPPEMLAAPRDWDLALSCYAPPPDGPLLAAADFVMGGGMSKFHAAQCFLQRQGRLDHWQTVLFLDDDLELGFDPSRLFAFMRQHGLALAQPALTADSHFTFHLTRANPGLLFRRTNYVETMAPAMTAAFLARVIGHFDRTVSTWGLDLLWSSAAAAGEAGVLDCFPMRHTRAVQRQDGPFYRYLASLGVDPRLELRSVLDALGLAAFEPRTLEAIARQDLIRRP